MSKRLKAIGQKRYRNGFKLTLHREALDEPYLWRKPRIVFVNSMSDLFHEKVSFEFIQDVFRVMNENKRHVFQILTKRSGRLVALAPQLKWSENIWMGVTVESNDYVFRADDLRKVNCAVKFLSLEPLLGPLPDLDLKKIDWVIVGGESGPSARLIKEEWVIEIKNLCERKKIPFFFKQWGGVNKKKAGRLLLGKTWDNYPKEAEREPCLL
jgi:protein gp37